MAAKDDLGRAGEERAVRHLFAHGYQILGRNWRAADGEVDIVAATGDDVVFVEVKTRRSLDCGHPFEAIDTVKRARLWRIAYSWVRAHPEVCRGRDLRVDAIGIVGDDPRTGVLEHLVDLR